MLIELKPGVDVAALDEINKRHGYSILHRMPNSNIYVVQLKDHLADSLPEAVAAYRQEVAVIGEVDYNHLTRREPDDFMYAKSGDIASQWGLRQIKAEHAWAETTGSRKIVVALIDTGVYVEHEDLAGNIWRNTGEDWTDNAVPGGNGKDDDGNGYIDDYRGWNFLDMNNNPNDLIADHGGHGTHCAGTIGAVGNNGTGVTGVCWEVSIMPLRVGTTTALFDSDIAEGINYAIAMKVQVMSNSYSSYEPSIFLRNAVKRADEAGIIFVAAAGNDAFNLDSTPAYPACFEFENMITVGATDDNDKNLYNWGPLSVHLGAPGKMILSTIPYDGGGGRYAFAAGTSMAVPFVAGACALVKAAAPSLTHYQIRSCILKNVDTPKALAGFYQTNGRLNLYKAVMAAKAVEAGEGQ